MESRRANFAFRAIVALLVALFAFAVVVRSVEPLGLDQGLFACFARWVPRGWLPYRDVFDSKPPLFLYTFALTAIVPGDVVRAMWRLEALWLAATLVVAHVVASKMFRDRWTGLATAALLFVGLWSPAWGAYWSRVQAEELLALPMIGAAYFAWRAKDPSKQTSPRASSIFAASCGLLTGVCGLFKVPSLAVAVAWIVFWLPSADESRDGSKSAPATDPPRATREEWIAAAKKIGLFSAGAVAPWAVVFVWFVAHGALHDFVEAVFVYQRHYAATIAPPWSNVIEELVRTELVRASWLIVCAAIGVFTLRRAKSPQLRLVAPWIVFTLAPIVLQRQLAGYHYILAVPALSFAGGRALVDLARAAFDESGERAPRNGATIALAVVLVLVGREAWSWRGAYGADFAHLRGDLSRTDYLRQIQQGPYSLTAEDEAARYVRDHTAPSGGILVWGLSPGIYALADRHPTTRYPFHKVLLTDAPFSRGYPGLADRRARLLETIRADPPVYVLVGRNDANGFELMDSVTSLVRFRELEEIVTQQYHPETEIGRFMVLRRGSLAAPASTP